MKPTVGRVVHYFPRPHEREELREAPGNPLAAIVATVHSETMVNLGVLDSSGYVHSRTSVPFRQPGDTPPPQEGGFATWPERETA